MPDLTETATADSPVEPIARGERLAAIPPAVIDAPARVRADDHVELKRGAFLNALAMLASNFRGIFTFLVARLLGAPALGICSVACRPATFWARVACSGSPPRFFRFPPARKPSVYA